MVKSEDLKHSNASVEIPCLMSNNVNVFTVYGYQKNKIEASQSIYFSTMFTINKVAGITHHYQYRKLHGSRSINEKSHACLAKCL